MGTNVYAAPLSHQFLGTPPASYINVSRETEDRQRDPHTVLQLTVATVARMKDPILHLPPLLSSLPAYHQPLFPNLDEALPLVLHSETPLPHIDPVSLSLHRALHHFGPIDSHYATTPYEAAFNWDELYLPAEEEREWYCVAFRSKRRVDSDSGPLYEQDAKAHAEAIRGGGLIMYWYGVPDPYTGANLATCIWQSRALAIAAASKPCHAAAMRLAAGSYDYYRLERYVLRKAAGETGVSVQVYTGGEVGW